MREVNTHPMLGAILVRRVLSDWGKRYGEVFNKKINVALKAEILKKHFHNGCAYCDRPLLKKDTVWDHAIPINKTHFGLHVFGNLVPAHRTCNSDKSDMTWSEFLAKNKAKSSEAGLRTKKYILTAQRNGIDVQLPQAARSTLTSSYEKFSKAAALEINTWRKHADTHSALLESKS